VTAISFSVEKNPVLIGSTLVAGGRRIEAHWFCGRRRRRRKELSDGVAANSISR